MGRRRGSLPGWAEQRVSKRRNLMGVRPWGAAHSESIKDVVMEPWANSHLTFALRQADLLPLLLPFGLPCGVSQTHPQQLWCDPVKRVLITDHLILNFHPPALGAGYVPVGINFQPWGFCYGNEKQANSARHAVFSLYLCQGWSYIVFSSRCTETTTLACKHLLNSQYVHYCCSDFTGFLFFPGMFFLLFLEWKPYFSIKVNCSFTIVSFILEYRHL